MIVFGLGKNLLFRSVLGHCDLSSQSLIFSMVNAMATAAFAFQCGIIGCGVFKGGIQFERLLAKNQLQSNEIIEFWELM